jgi:hypothetical protein
VSLGKLTDSCRAATFSPHDPNFRVRALGALSPMQIWDLGCGIWDLGSGFSVLGEPRERNLKAAVAEPAAPDAETGVWKSLAEVWSSGRFPRASSSHRQTFVALDGWRLATRCGL